jgi:hypothetical protein
VNDRFKTFPPGWAHLRIPVGSRASARAGLALYAPCRPGGRAVQRAAWAAVSMAGPRVLPGPARDWQPPMGQAVWTQLRDEWEATVGTIDTAAVYEQPQASRSGLALLLLRGGGPVGFVKVRRGDDHALRVEHAALTGLQGAGIRAFRAPEPLALGAHDAWAYLMTTALPPRLSRPPRAPDLTSVAADVQRGLRDALPRDGCPAHWQPMHGDLTPWNLREHRRGRLSLVDWEDAAWGPPGADEVLYRATAAALRDEPAATGPAEAVAFWRDRVAARPHDDRDAGFTARLAGALGSM